MPDLGKAPWNVVLAYNHLESFTSAGSSQRPTGPNRVLSLARFLAQLPKGDGRLAPILLDVPPPDRSHLLSVAEYLDDEDLAGVFSDVDLRLDDGGRSLPRKIINIFARYAAGIPTLRSYLQVGELTGGSALTCVGCDGRETPAMADIVAPPRYCEGIKPLSPAATSGMNKAP